jgi:hypothetical protein
MKRTIIAALVIGGLSALESGCTGVYTPKLSAISWGLGSAQVLNGLNVTRWKTEGTNDYYEIILDSSSGSQSSEKLVDGLIAVGEIAARTKGIPLPAVAGSSGAAVVDADDSVDTSSYAGVPAAGGAGVYGRPTCSRCAAYVASHDGAEIINIDVAANRAALWAALKARGCTETSVGLPVVVTDDGYTAAAK